MSHYQRREAKKHIRASHAPSISPRGASKRPAIPLGSSTAESEHLVPGVERGLELDREENVDSPDSGQAGHEYHFSQIAGVVSKQTSVGLEQRLPPC